MQKEPVVFLHSSFRTGSTWVHSRFRENPAFCTYYEAFNERLASLKNENLCRDNFSSWNSKHPPSVPYFLEYVPLLRPQGGVQNFRREFSYDYFFPEEPDVLSAEEQLYISKLIDNARRLGKTPVISFTRSLGRVSALKNAFGGLHILTYRNLFNQWCSYTEQAVTGNMSFMRTIDRIIEASRTDELVAVKHAYRTDILDANSTNLFLKFVLLHFHLYQHAAKAADYSIFLEDLNCDATRTELEDLVFQNTGCHIELSGYQERRQFSFIDADPLILREAISTFVNYKDPDLDVAARTVLIRAYETLLEAYTRYQEQFSPLLKAQKALHSQNVALAKELDQYKHGSFAHRLVGIVRQ